MAENSVTNLSLYQSGIIVPIPALAVPKGPSVNVPYFAPVTVSNSGQGQLLDDANPLVVQKQTANSMVSPVHNRGDAWGFNELAGSYAGADPVGYTLGKISEKWNEIIQLQAFKTLEGAVASASMSGSVLGNTNANAATFSASYMLDAQQLLGDAQSKLKALIVHSAVRTAMRKANLTDFELDSNNQQIEFYQGMRLIVNDAAPVDIANAVYTSYYVGEGVLGFADGHDLASIETDRDILAGDTNITSRRSYVLHPVGMTWGQALTGTTPSNTDIATGANWDRRFDKKNIPLIAVRCKVA
ncbi:MAG: hypothetical protein ABS78_19445 [Phenylobacterium sp. SCN 70-31]|nr:MAG: hypothetical protein ABS78_19445 [Phenylobacterium sp. SCN 70-31]